MPKLGTFCIAALAALFLSVPAMAGKTKNVILVISDGVRWQEVFTGADPTLLNDKAGGSWTPVPELKQRFWSDDVEARRKLLFPFLWGTIGTEGQIFGNQHAGSIARVTNPMWFSYTGYNEMSSGVADPKIDSNEFGPNPNVTVFEWLNTLPDLAGQVEIFGTWQTFADIFNVKRSKLPIRAGASLVDATDHSPRGQLLLELYQTTTRLELADPFDSFLHVSLRDHLKTHHPRVLFVGYGDTDTWQHVGRYDAFLETAHSFDAFVGDLWNQVQSIPEYKDSTTLIISTDHGRGGGLVEWKEHGTKEKGSNNIWIAVIGPDTPALGERHHVHQVTQSQIASTVAAFLGKDFRAYKPAAAPSLIEALAPPVASH